jgi:cytochrome P450
MHAEVPQPDGTVDRISTKDFAEFVKLLLIGGNETTRNAITHGVILFERHPAEKQRFLADPDGLAASAADEILRYTAPVTLMRRTATRPTEVAGAPIAEGDKVVMWYRAANFDEEAFADPYRFDVTRSPNDHFSFGAGGPHFCLGASLARLEIAAMLTTLYRRLPDLEITGDAIRMRALSSHAVKHLPVRWTPPS